MFTVASNKFFARYTYMMMGIKKNPRLFEQISEMQTCLRDIIPKKVY
jgi:hypothetical protein